MALYFFHKSPYEPKFCPIIRIISDFGNTDTMLGAMDTGVEQRAFSEHRVDFMDYFHDGRYLEIPLNTVPKTTMDGKQLKKVSLKK